MRTRYWKAIGFSNTLSFWGHLVYVLHCLLLQCYYSASHRPVCPWANWNSSPSPSSSYLPTCSTSLLVSSLAQGSESWGPSSSFRGKRLWWALLSTLTALLGLVSEVRGEQQYRVASSSPWRWRAQSHLTSADDGIAWRNKRGRMPCELPGGRATICDIPGMLNIILPQTTEAVSSSGSIKDLPISPDSNLVGWCLETLGENF